MSRKIGARHPVDASFYQIRVGQPDRPVVSEEFRFFDGQIIDVAHISVGETYPTRVPTVGKSNLERLMVIPGPRVLHVAGSHALSKRTQSQAQGTIFWFLFRFI